jgi:hypothetical protein
LTPEEEISLLKTYIIDNQKNIIELQKAIQTFSGFFIDISKRLDTIDETINDEEGTAIDEPGEPIQHPVTPMQQPAPQPTVMVVQDTDIEEERMYV